MNLTEQGYYNAIVHVADPDDLWELFEPSRPGEETGRLDDVEQAIRFISDSLDSDNFNSPTSDEWDTQELLMKGYILEGIRFRILREEWEPVFEPFPRDPLQYYDPDVTVIQTDYGISRMSAWVKLRQVPGEMAHSGDPLTIYIHDNLDDEDADHNFWMDSLGIRVEGDNLRDVLDEFHDEVEENFDPAIAEELGEKLAKFYQEASLHIDGIDEDGT